MYTTIQEVIEAAKARSGDKVVALASAHDKDLLVCAAEAREIGLCRFVLIGDKGKINFFLKEIGQCEQDWDIVDEKDAEKAASLAVGMVRQGQAHMPMKGILPTAVFMREILNKERGLLDPGSYVSAVTIAELPREGRLMLVSDQAMSIAPDYKDKVKITQNAVKLAHDLGFACPKIAFLAPVESVNPAIQSCVEAAMLAKAADRGQFGACIGEGPLALDVAVSAEAARIKGLKRRYDGPADILIVPDLNSGNILDKAMRYLAHLKTGSMLLGPRVPVIATSRSDTPETKLASIAFALVSV
jgi:phosphate butyryltransferase